MDLENIRRLGEKRPGGLRKLATDIGMSESNLHRCMNNNKIQASDLEKIAKLLGVNIGVFFGETPQQPAVKYASPLEGNTDKAGEAELLNDKIRILEQLIQEKERTIQILMNK